MAALLLLLALFATIVVPLSGEPVGVCYGMMGNNLPSKQEVIGLYGQYNIRRMRLYDPNGEALNALRNSGIELVLGVPNSDLRSLATNPSAARWWVQTNVLNYYPAVRFRFIAVGNEVVPSNGGGDVLPAMRNVYDAIRGANLQDQIKVSTAIDMTLIGTSFPPSAGAFRGDVRSYIDPIISFLVSTNSALLANIYPYFSYTSNPRDISLPYALFTSPSVVVWDNGRGYQNLFDAILDALYSAIERSGGGSLPVVISESGWPSGGGFAATLDNARAFCTNLAARVRDNRGTPKRPGGRLETYLFAMFDENWKSPDIEKNFGVFYPNKQPKFPIGFSATGRIGYSDVYGWGNNVTSFRSDV
ncbi:PREDICTED: probable glucan endo-1,3-beta-glucosidase At4g16260 [Tarenaya hassleriana]|uniref:probable glucan endo-1,3-beta-glucosidase At4g16260 n=1 Tax=Tarenaya hassleriana TaxID=28532 RepID=UPI00053C56AA|nr:PREDICTED: probable glucan endo-1,3-beta-glucosidase At4g16260 [Tarenaya hassleriana]